MKNQKLPKYLAAKPLDRKLSKEEIQARFNRETASVYSQKDPVHLPEYATALSLLMDGISGALPAAGAMVLDLGAGTGNLSRRFLDRFPESHATLVDFSENMLNETKIVLSDHEGKYDLLRQDMFSTQFPAQMFDAVISSFSIHHARGRRQYLSLYKKIHYWLKPGGVFSCCDVVDGDTPLWTAVNESGWKTHLAFHYDQDQIDRLFENYRVEDTPLSLFNHLSCLKDAGFVHVDVLWKKHNFAVYCGQV